MSLAVRKVRPEDASAIVDILNPIISDGNLSVLDAHLSVEDEQEYIERFPVRGVFLVAENEEGRIVGFQSVEPFATYTHAFDHVGTIGTFVGLPYRRQGVGTVLAKATFATTRDAGFEKLLTYILATNAVSLAFHQRLGFTVVGTARRQARLGGRYVDEVFIERFLDDV
ncbi:MAG: GNAT family N-acetyltransferase [Methanopyri archaeon]|jgi:L-amino acid N-acyltransferase YncA|nr:GNAT family N-acetyltransferase [Methanopyri archaeon]